LSFTAYTQEFLPVVCAGGATQYKVGGWENSDYTWKLEGGLGTITAGNGSNTIDIQWGGKGGVFILKVVELSEFGCWGDTLEVSGIVYSPFVQFNEDLIFCNDDVMMLEPEYDADAAFAFQWLSKSTGTEILGEQNFLRVDQARNDTFYLDYWADTTYHGLYSGELQAPLVCKASDSIVTYERPYPVLNLGDDIVLCGAQELELNGSQFEPDSTKNDVDYYWYVNDRMEMPDESGQYYSVDAGEKDIIVEANLLWQIDDARDAMCEAYDTIHISHCKAEDLWVARAFMPDEDGENRTWKVKQAEGAQLPMEIEVYNRWGQRVWYYNGVYENDWDGKTSANRPLPMDSYYYIISIEIVAGEWIKKQGTVTIVR